MTFACRLTVLLTLMGVIGLSPAQAQDAAERADTSETSSAPRDADLETDQLLRAALENNPDILAARSAVAMAEAELNRVRSQVTREVLAMRGKLVHLEELADYSRTKIDQGLMSLAELIPVQTELIELKESLRYLSGSMSAPGERVLRAATAPRAATPAPHQSTPRPAYPDDVDEHMHHVLESQAGIIFDDVDLFVVLNFISDTFELNFVTDVGFTPPKVTINLKNVALKDIFKALSDQSGNETCFIIRDYGIFVTSRERATTIPGPSIPADVPFYESKPSRVPAAAPSAGEPD